jgi:AcrR family transcriptional regulator
VAGRRTEESPSTREENVTALMDAAERILVRDGAAGTTTRSVAAEAGLNHGLVHYYFGSMEELLLQVLERFTERLTTRQREMYGADVPFLQKWRSAMGFLDEDLEAGYPKIWFELQSLAWNRPELRERLIQVEAEWRELLTDAFGRALRDEYGLDWPTDAVVSLVVTFNLGMQSEALLGIRTGHRELLEWIDAWLVSLRNATNGKGGNEGR